MFLRLGDHDCSHEYCNNLHCQDQFLVYSAPREVACPTESHCAPVTTASSANLGLQKLFLSIIDYGAASGSASLATSQ